MIREVKKIPNSCQEMSDLYIPRTFNDFWLTEFDGFLNELKNSSCLIDEMIDKRFSLYDSFICDDDAEEVNIKYFKERLSEVKEEIKYRSIILKRDGKEFVGVIYDNCHFHETKKGELI